MACRRGRLTLAYKTLGHYPRIAELKSGPLGLFKQAHALLLPVFATADSRAITTERHRYWLRRSFWASRVGHQRFTSSFWRPLRQSRGGWPDDFPQRGASPSDNTGSPKFGGIKPMKKLILAAGTACAMIAIPTVSFAQVDVGVSITLAPPELPVYEQPPIPEQNDIWTPGYWAYGDEGYFWVPGTWVQAPQVGFLWTPAYWGYGDGGYAFHAGYWGPHIGFYGGINYGYGYGGSGYQGGRWDHGQFAYNRTVNNITNTTIIKNVYNENVVNNTTTRVSFNGGNGGVRAEPTAEERQFAAAPHIPPTSVQMQHQQEAKSDRNQLASVNHGAPPIAATPRPGVMSGAGVVHGRAAEAQEAPHGAPNQAPNRAPQAPAAGHSQVPQPPQHAQEMQRQPAAQSPHAPAVEHAPAMQRQPEAQSPHAPAAEHAPAMQRQPEAQSPRAPAVERAPAMQRQPAEQHAQPQHQAAPQQHQAEAPRQQAAPRPAEQHAAPKGGDEHGDEKKQ